MLVLLGQVLCIVFFVFQMHVILFLCFQLWVSVQLISCKDSSPLWPVMCWCKSLLTQLNILSVWRYQLYLVSGWRYSLITCSVVVTMMCCYLSWLTVMLHLICPLSVYWLGVFCVASQSACIQRCCLADYDCLQWSSYRLFVSACMSVSVFASCYAHVWVCVSFVWLPPCHFTHTHAVSADHEAHPDVPRYRGSLNEDSASASWSSPYAERNVSHSVAYTSSGKGRRKWLMLWILTKCVCVCVCVCCNLYLSSLLLCPSFKMATLIAFFSTAFIFKISRSLDGHSDILLCRPGCFLILPILLWYLPTNWLPAYISSTF